MYAYMGSSQQDVFPLYYALTVDGIETQDLGGLNTALFGFPNR